MKSTMLYDWWLRDGMINTDRHLDWPWRRVLVITEVDLWRGNDDSYWSVRYWADWRQNAPHPELLDSINLN